MQKYKTKPVTVHAVQLDSYLAIGKKEESAEAWLIFDVDDNVSILDNDEFNRFFEKANQEGTNE